MAQRYVFTKKAREIMRRKHLSKAEVIAAVRSSQLLHCNVAGALNTFVYLAERFMLVGAVHKEKPHCHLVIAVWSKSQ